MERLADSRILIVNINSIRAVLQKKKPVIDLCSFCVVLWSFFVHLVIIWILWGIIKKLLCGIHIIVYQIFLLVFLCFRHLMTLSFEDRTSSRLSSFCPAAASVGSIRRYHDGISWVRKWNISGFVRRRSDFCSLGKQSWESSSTVWNESLSYLHITTIPKIMSFWQGIGEFSNRGALKNKH